MPVAGHRDLLVWQRAVELAIASYDLTKFFPKSEAYGLSSQLQRAAVSISANIAEGKGRGSTGAYLNHLGIAAGSLAELDTQVEVARRLGYVKSEHAQNVIEKIEEVGRMLTGLRKSLEGRIPKS
ncbi:four helix bundle protein [Planctomicrobium piriforme]|uniref:Four helix bundle protein n=1 Tax=Planctomicrobium piriforme TaxID=1576369 RepID=A0A1I3S362_9PLAN|nr:four helix bundle protein [Planctomicrobium piriforme]SFJ53323.1 four helix bundle protein [Planctomicrobium piriforme]